MLLSLVVGAVYLRANLPPRPGVFWLFPSPSTETPTELQRKAEAAPEYQSALAAANRERNAMIVRAFTVWLMSGAAFYGAGMTIHRARRVR